MKKSLEKIFEISIARVSTDIAPPTPFDLPSINPNISPISPISHYNKPRELYHWQKLLLNDIENTNKDIFVLVEPAAGKTTPFIEAWKRSFQVMSHTSNIKDIKTILWVCPTIQLASQVYNDDLLNNIWGMVQNWISNQAKSPFPITLLPGAIAKKIYDNLKTTPTANDISITHDEFYELQRHISQKLALRTGAGSKGGEVNQNTIAAVCTYSFAANIYKTMKPDYVVIDETQQYVPKDSKNEDMEDALFNLFDEMKGNDSRLIMLTGSMNEQTANNICLFLNKYFDRKFTSKPFTAPGPEGKNKSFIKVNPTINLRNKQDIINLATQKIHMNSNGNAVVIFSVRDLDPKLYRKMAIMPICQELIEKLPQRAIYNVTGAMPNSDDVKHHGIYDSHKNTLAQSAAINKSYFEDPQYQANYLQKLLDDDEIRKRKQYYDSGRRYTLQSVEYGWTPSFVAKCILRGFAFMSGGADVGHLDSDEILLVQTLFKQGKINVLLATDMIGVGTTIAVHNLYLPKLQKPINKNGKVVFGQIDESSLVQLINRVGRNPFIVGNIYCNPNDYTVVSEALSSNSTEFVPEINVSHLERPSIVIKYNLKKMLELMRKAAVNIHGGAVNLSDYLRNSNNDMWW